MYRKVQGTPANKIVRVVKLTVASCPEFEHELYEKIHQALLRQTNKVFFSKNRQQNSRFFFLKISKEIVKRDVRVLSSRSARASHAVHFPYNEFVPTRGFKNVVELSKSVYNSSLFVNLIHSVIDFEGE